jgi:hypothetical protein
VKNKNTNLYKLKNTNSKKQTTLFDINKEN